MNQTAIEKTAEFIESIDEPLRGILKGHSEKQLFENIYIAKQIELRKQDKIPVQDKDSELSYHIRGMI